MRSAPLIMGVLNITPDSFSDGGNFLSKEAAMEQARLLVREGADILDVGGESTRPGAAAVSAKEEIERVIPVVEAVARELPVRVSIDTSKPEVAAEAMKAGATVLNDVTGGADPRMAELAARGGVDVLLMHMQGVPRTMQAEPSYPRGVVTEVKEYLQARVRAFGEAGVPAERIWVDPGIGFGKTQEHNLELLRNLDAFQGIGGRLAIGTSRKSFLARVLGSPETPMSQREPGTIASNLWAYAKGASVFRVHDVGALRRALTTWEAIEK